MLKFHILLYICYTSIFKKKKEEEEEEEAEKEEENIVASLTDSLVCSLVLISN